MRLNFLSTPFLESYITKLCLKTQSIQIFAHSQLIFTLMYNFFQYFYILYSLKAHNT